MTAKERYELHRHHCKRTPSYCSICRDLRAAMEADPWEQLRFTTVDQLITQTKLGGSAMALTGNTTPEGWPFFIVIAVASPGNEPVVTATARFATELVALAPPLIVERRK